MGRAAMSESYLPKWSIRWASWGLNDRLATTAALHNEQVWLQNPGVGTTLQPIPHLSNAQPYLLLLRTIPEKPATQSVVSTQPEIMCNKK